MSLPSGYKRLEYIQSSGTQYINTGFTPSGENMRVVFDFMYTAAHSSHSLYGVQTSSNEFSITAYSNPKFYVGKSFELLPQTTSLNVRYLLDAHANNGTLTVSLNGTTSSSAYSGSLDKTLSLSLFGNNLNGSTTQLVSAKLYSCQIYDNGILVRDFIPCQKPDGTNGLWDDVNSVFYGNAGTGTFTAGTVLAIAADASEITELEYIQSSGTQYIDTGVVPDANTKVECDFLAKTLDCGVFGARIDYNNNAFTLFWSATNAAAIEIGNVFFAIGAKAVVNKRCIVEMSATRFNLDGETLQTYSQTAIAPSVPIYIFWSSGASFSKLSGRVYSFKIYDNGTLFRDYIASKLADGTVGLYDKLNGLFYGNAGTGTFTAGPVVASPSIFVNIDGIWKPINHIYVNINNIWQKST